MQSGSSANLNDCHSYFLLVDDGTSGKYGCEIGFRRRLEKYLSRHKSEIYINFHFKNKYFVYFTKLYFIVAWDTTSKWKKIKHFFLFLKSFYQKKNINDLTWQSKKKVCFWLFFFFINYSSFFLSSHSYKSTYNTISLPCYRRWYKYNTKCIGKCSK